MIRFRVRNKEFIIPLSISGSACLFSGFNWASITSKLQEAEFEVRSSQFMQEVAPYATVYEFSEQYYQYKDQALVWQTVALIFAIIFIVLFIADRWIYYKKTKDLSDM